MRSCSSFTTCGWETGLYIPTTSRQRLLRARSFSITTTRYDGFFLAPKRAKRIINIYTPKFLVYPIGVGSLAKRQLQTSGQLHFAKPFAHLHEPASGEALHHFARLRILLQQRIHFLHRRPAAFGDAPAACAVDEHVIGAFLGGHRIDDRHHARNLTLIHFHVLHVLHWPDGHHLQNVLQRAQFPDLFDLIAEVFERELVVQQLALHLFGLPLIDILLDLFNQRQHIAHAENALHHAVGMK